MAYPARPDPERTGDSRIVGVTFRPLAPDESRHAGLVCHAEVHFNLGPSLELTLWLDRNRLKHYVHFPIAYDGNTTDLQRLVVDAYLEQSCHGVGVGGYTPSEDGEKKRG